MALSPLRAHGALTVVILHIFVTPYAMQDPTSPLAIATQAAFYAMLGATLIGVRAQRLLTTVCIGLVVAATAIRLTAAEEARFAQASADLALVGASTMALAVSIRRILHARAATQALVSAAVTTYLLSGIIWAIAFHALQSIQPGAFGVLGRPSAVTAGDLYYFSFVTLTTLGYGDVSPMTPFARSCATLEAVFAQIFLVALLGRLVSLQIAPVPPTLPQPREHEAPN